MKFKGVLIASDLDGTLFDSNKKISDKNAEAIKYFQENGGIFTIATGRASMLVDNLLDKINLNVPIVLVNGAVLYDYNKKEKISVSSMYKETIEVAKHLTEKFPQIGCEIFAEDGAYLVKYNSALNRHMEMIGLDSTLCTFEEIPSSDTWIKMNFAHVDFNELDKISNYAKKQFGNDYNVCYSCSIFFEMTSLRARKDIAVFELADKLNISREHVYTIGDNFNDLEMVRDAKIGFCPENAEDGVKAVSKKIVPSCDDDAIYHMIQHLDELY